MAFPLRQQTEAALAAAAAKEAEFRLDLAVRLMCPDCRNPEPNIVENYSAGDLICGDCGLVLGDRIIDTRSEWRTFANDEGGDDPSRVGAPVNHLAGQAEQFETAISFKDGNSGLAKDLQRAQLRISGKNAAGVAQRNLGGAFRDIDAMCNQISLPRAVADVAKQLFKRVDDERLCRGKTPRAVHAACVFVACRTQGVGRSFKEIAQLSGTSKKHVADCFKVIQRAFDISGGGAAAAGEGAGGADDGSTIKHPAFDVVVRLCSGLALPPYVQAAAQGVVTRSTEHGLLTGRDPYTVAGACLFFACHLLNQPKSFSEISGISGMAESTLRQAYRYLYVDRVKVAGTKLVANGGRGDMSRLPPA